MANEKSIIGAGGGDYTTVNSWESFMDGLLNGEAQTGIITGLTGDNSAVFINGITGSTNICRIEAASGEEADGTDAKGAQIDIRIACAEVSDQVVVEFNGIEFHALALIGISFGNADSKVTITKCVFRDFNPGAGTGSIDIGGAGDVEINIGVCLFRDGTVNNFQAGIKLNAASITTKMSVLNCTFYGLSIGINEINGTFTDVRNSAFCCYVLDTVNDNDTLNTPSNVTYCAGSGEGVSFGGTGSIDTLTGDDADDFTEPSASATNASAFVPYNTDSILAAAGQTISGEAWFPATDLAGVTWAATPSIGCFEIAAAPAGGQPFIKRFGGVPYAAINRGVW